MSEKKTMTLADQDVGKATALTAGVSLLMADAAGNISKIDADRLMELVRGSIKIGGRNLLRKTNQGTANWGVNADAGYQKVIEEYVFSDGTRGARLAATPKDPATASYRMATYSLKETLPKLRRNHDYTLGFRILSDEAAILSVSIVKATSRDILTDIPLVEIPAGETAVVAPLRTVDFQDSAVDGQIIRIMLASGSTLDLRICDLKLEEGNVATGWTPAPEDLTENRGG